MSHIDELIAELAPNGVPFYPMWQLTTWDKRFNAVDRHKQPRIGKYRYLLAKELSPLAVEGGDVKILTTNESNLWTNEEIVAGPVHDAEIIAIPWGGNAIVQHYSGRFITSDNRIAIANDPEQLDMKFLYYFMTNNLGELASFYRGSGIKHPSMAKVLDWRIPVPPLEVQREIVRVLDQFTQLEAELEAELEARRRQYEHYRRTVLDKAFDGSSVRKLGEIADLNWGDTNTTKSSYIKNGGYIAFSAAGPDGMLDHFDYDRNAVVLSAIGALSGKTWRASGRWSCIKNTIRFFSRDESVVLTDYLYWVTSVAGFWPRRGSAQPFISKGDADQVLIPVPSIEEQRRVVRTLDKFDALVNDITSGLPAEIAARRKQYEYYRDKLLTFTEAA
ncbi:Type I restriction enzyme specificity protein MPN_089 [Mycobacteroides abscessus subsp. abscessus]|nr:Type I restriction enzyme specificity protein MPN_089 [Mycobacteroides abscessus subsp. abscessus]